MTAPVKICVYCSWCPLTAAAELEVNLLILVRNIARHHELHPRARRNPNILVFVNTISEIRVLLPFTAIFLPAYPMAANFERFAGSLEMLNFVQFVQQLNIALSTPAQWFDAYRM